MDKQSRITRFPCWELVTTLGQLKPEVLPHAQLAEHHEEMLCRNLYSTPNFLISQGQCGTKEELEEPGNLSPRLHLEMLPPSFYQTYEEMISRLNKPKFLEGNESNVFITLPSSDEVPLLLPDPDDSPEMGKTKLGKPDCPRHKLVFRIEKAGAATDLKPPHQETKRGRKKSKEVGPQEKRKVERHRVKRAYTMLTEPSTVGEPTPALLAISLKDDEIIKRGRKRKMAEKPTELTSTDTLPGVVKPIFKFVKVIHSP